MIHAALALRGHGKDGIPIKCLLAAEHYPF